MKHKLEITGLQKKYGEKLLLNNVKIALQSGDIMGLMGRNGSGKSTLLKILFGTEKANAITIHYNNTKISPKQIIKDQLVAYMPQRSFVPKTLKVGNIISMFIEEPENQDRIFYSFNMHRLTNTQAGKLSQGELRYFDFLLITNLPHPFLLLDEPFSMIEPLYKEKITECLHELKKTKGIIITDHYYNDILTVSTKNFLLKNGTFTPICSLKDLELNGYLPKQTE